MRPSQPFARIWKDSTDDKVVLKRADKTEITVPLAKLSVADRQYVQKRLTPSPDVDICKAAGDGNLESLKQHITAGTGLNQRSRDKQTPLFEAAFYGRTEAAKALIEAGAKLDLKNKGGSTALMNAVFYAIRRLSRPCWTRVLTSMSQTIQEQLHCSPLKLLSVMSNPSMMLLMDWFSNLTESPWIMSELRQRDPRLPKRCINSR